MKETRPNILLITTDQQRFDTLSFCNKDSGVNTPNLEALAKRGVNFTQAFVQNPVCIPSRACWQTGRYTHQHGVTYMEEIIDDTPGLPAWELSFMERLQCAGYRTAAFGKIHMMPEKGFDELKVTGGKGVRWTKSAGLPIGLGPLGRDYAAWLEARNPGAYEKIYAGRNVPEYKKYRSAITANLPVEDYIESWITENTEEFITRDHDKPFFAWCGFCGPHDPFDPPEPYASMYKPEDINLPPNFGYDTGGQPVNQTEEQITAAKKIVCHYYALVSLIDDMIGRLMAALEKKGILDNTLIIFTSDHGEMLGEFGRYGKGNFYDSIIHVPFIASFPGNVKGGGTVADLIETYDLAPTVLDYAGAGIPRTMSASSLRPILEKTKTGRELIISEFTTYDRKRTGICIRTPAHKYWRYTDGEEAFFDLASDPYERENRISDPALASDIRHLRDLLLDRLMECANCTPTKNGVW
ncbi:MAG: sulfatase-like hydrolase/transferase [Gammaproteobacteria bacterium]|nr:sulfatase-like hydrolase/transferase [Gammaproteobacteria bacterium]